MYVIIITYVGYVINFLPCPKWSFIQLAILGKQATFTDNTKERKFFRWKINIDMMYKTMISCMEKI